MIMAAGGIEFTDKRYTFEDWPAAKPSLYF